MSDHYQLLAYVALACGALAGVGHSIAAIIRETYRGKALLIKASKDHIIDTTSLIENTESAEFPGGDKSTSRRLRWPIKPS